MKKKIFTRGMTLLLVTLIIFSSLAVNVSATAASTDTLYAESIPPEYSNDPYEQQYVTSVKDQGEYGLCWAFAAIACAEADAIKNHGAAPNEIDLSEWHLGYFTYYGERESTGDTVTLLGNVPYYNLGGNDVMSHLTLSNWIGFADESVAPYGDLVAPYNTTLDPALINECRYKLKNAVMLDIEKNPNEVKKAIMEYGAVSVSYYGDESYTNESTFAHYCGNDSYVADHAVTVVGWDDNYSKTNFSFSHRPSKDGAWLVKNSWGSEWGLGGYFWISYEEATFEPATYYDVIPSDEYDNLYSHAGGMSLSYMESSMELDVSAMTNLFVARSPEILTSVSVSTFIDYYTTPITDKPYKLNIYKNPRSIDTDSDDFGFGTPVYTTTGMLSPGLTTVDLSQPIRLSTGDVFVVEFETDAFILVDYTNTTELTYTSSIETMSTVKNYQSYYKSEGKWYDLGNEEQPFNFRINAETVNSTHADIETDKFNDPSKRQLRVENAPIFTSIAYGQTVDRASMTYSGKVVDAITGIEVDGSWRILLPKATPRDQENITLIFTPFNNVYSPLTLKTPISVNTVTPTISITPSSTYYLEGDTVLLSVTLENLENKNLNDFGAYSLYYVIDETGEKVKIEGNQFVIPDGASNKEITICCEYEGKDGMYNSAEAQYTLEVGNSLVVLVVIMIIFFTYVCSIIIGAIIFETTKWILFAMALITLIAIAIVPAAVAIVIYSVRKNRKKDKKLK